MRWTAVFLAGWVMAMTSAVAVEPYRRPLSVLPAEIVYLEGAVNLLRAPGHEVNAIVGDRMGNGEVLLVGPWSKAVVRLKDGTRITASHEARMTMTPFEGMEDESAEIVMTRGRFLVRRPSTHGRLPDYRLVSACGAIRGGDFSWRVYSGDNECVYDGLGVTDPALTPVVAVFDGYVKRPWAGRDRSWVFERDPQWYVGPQK